MVMFKAEFQMVRAGRPIEVEITFFAYDILAAKRFLIVEFGADIYIYRLVQLDVNNSVIVEQDQSTTRGHEVRGKSRNRPRGSGQGRQGPEIDDM